MSKKATALLAITPILGVASVCALSWLAGYEFDHRGPEAVVTAFLSMIGALMGFGFAASMIAALDWD